MYHQLILLEPCAAVESVKAADDFSSPVSGEVIEINEQLADRPSLVGRSAQKDGACCFLLHHQFMYLTMPSSISGWLFAIKLSDASELKSLMSEEQYLKFLESESAE